MILEPPHLCFEAPLPQVLWYGQAPYALAAAPGGGGGGGDGGDGAGSAGAEVIANGASSAGQFNGADFQSGQVIGGALS